MSAAGDFWAFQAKDFLNILILIATIFAIYLGPVRAVRVARKEETRALRERQKGEIFASLMKTRRFQLDPEHVSSLNLIQVYFNNEAAVLAAFKAYIRLLARDQTDKAVWKERDDAFIELVYEIARAIGYAQDRKELEELAYSPKGWADDQDRVRRLHMDFIELLENRRALSVTSVMAPGSINPFPPRAQVMLPSSLTHPSPHR